MFFSMLLTLGLDSMFGTIEGILTIIEDLDVFHVRKEVVTLTVCGLSFLCGLIFTTRAGDSSATAAMQYFYRAA